MDRFCRKHRGSLLIDSMLIKTAGRIWTLLHCCPIDRDTTNSMITSKRGKFYDRVQICHASNAATRRVEIQATLFFVRATFTMGTLYRGIIHLRNGGTAYFVKYKYGPILRKTS